MHINQVHPIHMTLVDLMLCYALEFSVCVCVYFLLVVTDLINQNQCYMQKLV